MASIYDKSPLTSRFDKNELQEIDYDKYDAICNIIDKIIYNKIIAIIAYSK